MSKAKDLGENIFTRINTRKLRERAFSKLMKSIHPATMKIKGGNSYKVSIVERSGKQISVETMGRDDAFNVSGIQNVIFSFDVGPEKFFMQTTAEIDSPQFAKVSTLSELFKLQRRRNFRVELPYNLEPIVFLETIGENKVKHDFHVNDLSLGGLSFDVPMDSPLAIESGDMIHGQFRMEEGVLLFGFKAKVRHMVNVGSMGSGIRRIGIEFTPLDTETENFMLETLMKLQKDVIGGIAF